MTSRSLLEYRADVLHRVSALAPLDVSLAHAVGCVLAADVVAPAAVPPLPVAARDGYAVRCSDTRGARMRPVSLPVTHDVGPGHAPSRLARGAAARVARGASMPFGADAVVARALTEVATVLLDTEPAAGDGVELAGARVAAGDVVVSAGTRLGPGHIAAIAACGLSSATVTPLPRVAIIAVGTELVQASTSAHPSLVPAEPVPDASGAFLAALVTGAGARVVRVTAVPDEPSALRHAVDDAALQADLVITLGGTSNDWRDVVMPVLTTAFGATHQQVRLSPGDWHGMATVGDSDGRPVQLLAIPGHPLDAAAAFAGYVRHVILALGGLDPALPTAEAATSWSSPYGYAQVLPIVRSVREGRASVEPASAADPVTLADLARADGLAVVAESVTGVAPRDLLEIVWWQR